MIFVRINSDERRLDEVDESWINKAIAYFRRSGEPVCVSVRIDEPWACMRLCTPTCADGGGGCRPPTQRERKVLDLWRQLRLDELDFAAGNLTAFLKRLVKFK